MISFLQQHDNIFCHQHHFDAGAALQKHNPLSGQLITRLKRRKG
jgi:hypothetical protein